MTPANVQVITIKLLRQSSIRLVSCFANLNEKKPIDRWQTKGCEPRLQTCKHCYSCSSQTSQRWNSLRSGSPSVSPSGVSVLQIFISSSLSRALLDFSLVHDCIQSPLKETVSCQSPVQVVCRRSWHSTQMLASSCTHQHNCRSSKGAVTTPLSSCWGNDTSKWIIIPPVRVFFPDIIVIVTNN